MKQFVIGIFQTLVGLFAPIYMIFLLPFIKRDSIATYANGSVDNPPEWDNSLVRRGDLPSIFRFAQTMDMRYPGGMYEPTVKAAYGDGSYLRFLWTSYIWTGLRNRAQGLAFRFGKSAVDFIPNPWSTDRDRTGWVQNGNDYVFTREVDGMTRTFKRFGPIYFVYGYEVYKLIDGSFWAVNQFTINWAKQ